MVEYKKPQLNISPITITMKVSNSCNLNCVYCYETKNMNTQDPIMSLEIVEKVIGDFSRLDYGNIQFIWHGGEPLLAGIDYFSQVVNIQKKLNNQGVHISNCLQTNGILLDNEWIRFATEHKFGIGISFDGPASIHNIQRPAHSGLSFERTLRSIKLLQDNNFPFIIACVITSLGIKSPNLFWDYFIDNEIMEFDFLPCLSYPSNIPTSTYSSVSDWDFSEFMTHIFDKWIEHNDDAINIKLLENIIFNMIQGCQSTLCKLSGRCEDFYTITTNGELYACDSFVGDPEYCYGDIRKLDIYKIISNEELNIKKRLTTLNNECQHCDWIEVCKGGCPFQHYNARFNSNFESINCSGKKMLFSHIYNKIRGHVC